MTISQAELNTHPECEWTLLWQSDNKVVAIAIPKVQNWQDNITFFNIFRYFETNSRMTLKLRVGVLWKKSYWQIKLLSFLCYSYPNVICYAICLVCGTIKADYYIISVGILVCGCIQWIFLSLELRVHNKLKPRAKTSCTILVSKADIIYDCLYIVLTDKNIFTFKKYLRFYFK